MSGWSRAAHRLGMAILLAFAGLSTSAADYPSQPVKLIVPWPAGGSSDIALRSLADVAARHLGQPVIIDNKPGASGTLGPTVMVSTAKPDGYTITQMPISVFRQPFLMKTSYDPLKDFTYIIHLTGYTFGVVVRGRALAQLGRVYRLRQGQSRQDQLRIAGHRHQPPHHHVADRRDARHRLAACPL